MHNIPPLYGPQYDFPDWDGSPKCMYMIASVPRSGSTYFYLSLWKTGLLGSPLEYFNFKDRVHLIKYVANGDIFLYWQYLQRKRTTPNGLFGYKIFIPNLVEMAERYEGLLEHITPDHVIYFTRRDKIAQAVSYAKATQTNAWFAGVKYARAPEYDTALIDKMIGWIEVQERSWENLFTLKCVEPIRLFYEDFIESEQEIFHQIFKKLSITPKLASRVVLPEMHKQSDRVNSDWIEMYKSQTSFRSIAPSP